MQNYNVKATVNNMTKSIQPTKTYNDIVYGKATIFAVAMNEWILPNRSKTNDHAKAVRFAVRMNRIMGGKATASQKFSAGV